MPTCIISSPIIKWKGAEQTKMLNVWKLEKPRFLKNTLMAAVCENKTKFQILEFA